MYYTNLKHLLILALGLCFFTSCSDLELTDRSDFSQNEIISKWAENYFISTEDILPSKLSEFSQVAINSLYETKSIANNIQVDTIDFILNTPFRSKVEDAANFTIDVLHNINYEIEANPENFYGAIILPKSINGKMYTRVFLLFDQNEIETRLSTCEYSSDFHWNDEQSCGNTKPYKEIEARFNKKCYWRTSPQNQTPNTIRTFKFAPHIYEDEEYSFDIPCNSLEDCFENFTNDYIQPQSCHVLTVDPDYCSALENTNSEGPNYRLFHRTKDNLSQCISKEDMNFYQRGIEHLAYDLMVNNICGLDLSWNYLKVFMESQGSNTNDKWHIALFIYEKQVPTLSL